MENNRPFFSIVMPIYNVEKHLQQAVESVLQQTFQDYEIILVDDCSPDKCPEICDEYAQKYESVQVIHHKENQGLSYTRNTGMAVAKRIQAPPILAISRRAYGFDHRESQNGPYYTRTYKELKKQLLGEKI